MAHVIAVIVVVLWLLFAGYWWISSLRVKQTARRESLGSRATHIVPLMIAGYLVSTDHLPGIDIAIRAYRPSPAALLVELAGVAIGLGFAVWARQRLGQNWSGIVTVKDDHELVRTGPYRIVRHPIYTGIIVALAGMALGGGTWTAFLAVAIVVLTFLRKLHIEERFMLDQFGEQYADYRRTVPALLPGL